MTTYTKETALYDTGKIGDDIAEAGTTASKYITAVGNDGIKVHPYNDTTQTADQYNYSKIDSNGMEVWKNDNGTSKRVASFGATSIIGKSGESRLEMDYHSLQMIDKEGDTYLWFSDLRDSTGCATVTERIVADYDDQDTYYTTLDISSVISVKAYGWSLPYTLDVNNKKKITITFTTSVPHIYKYDSIEVEYVTTSQGAKAYTIGKRGNNSYDSPTIGIGSVAEGIDVVASGVYSHAEGFETEASGSRAHAEGDTSRASGFGSHAEGMSISSGKYSHAEGMGTSASGLCSHAEGVSSTASESAAHAEGYGTTASGRISHAQNRGTIASKNAQTSLGTYNKEDTSSTTTHPSGTASYGQYAVIVGNGTDVNARSNALTVDWSGDVCLALNTTAASGTTDGNLYAAIVAIGWQNNVIV